MILLEKLKEITAFLGIKDEDPFTALEIIQGGKPKTQRVKKTVYLVDEVAGDQDRNYVVWTESMTDDHDSDVAVWALAGWHNNESVPFPALKDILQEGNGKFSVNFADGRYLMVEEG